MHMKDVTVGWKLWIMQFQVTTELTSANTLHEWKLCWSQTRKQSLISA
jgi:hypothetical protein